MVKIERLSVTYPDKTLAVDSAELILKEGENVALIGANGAGKTSLIMALVGILPFEGEIEVDGISLNKETVGLIRSKVGVVFQDPDNQLFMPTVYEDIAFGLRNMGLSTQEIDERISKWLDALRINHLRDKTSLKMSGGEKRMVSLATVLVMEPSVMVLDEPTAFLDPKARRNLINVLKSLPHTKLIATHDLSFAAQVCPKSVLLKEGKVFAQGLSQQLLYNEELMERCGVEAIGIYEKGRSES